MTLDHTRSFSDNFHYFWSHAQQVKKLLYAHVHEIDPLVLCVINRKFLCQTPLESSCSQLSESGNCFPIRGGARRVRPFIDPPLKYRLISIVTYGNNEIFDLNFAIPQTGPKITKVARKTIGMVQFHPSDAHFEFLQYLGFSSSSLTDSVILVTPVHCNLRDHK